MSINWMTILHTATRIARGVIPIIEAEFPALKAVAVAGTGVALAGAALDAVDAKGSPASVADVASAAMNVAQKAGLSAQDQANTAAFVSAAQEFAPIMVALGTAGMSADHVALGNDGLGYAQAVASGVLSAMAPTSTESAALPAPVAS